MLLALAVEQTGLCEPERETAAKGSAAASMAALEYSPGRTDSVWQAVDFGQAAVAAEELEARSLRPHLESLPQERLAQIAAEEQTEQVGAEWVLSFDFAAVWQTEWQTAAAVERQAVEHAVAGSSQ